MTRSLPLLLAALLALFPSTRAKADEIRRIAIDPAKQQGTWKGWGVSLAWWAAVLGDRDDLADALFTTRAVAVDGEILPGLGLNIVRYNAGASSWNRIGNRKMIESKAISRVRQIEGFWLDGTNPDPASTAA